MSAVISECGKYRYLLRRQLSDAGGEIRNCLFIMLNPSTADASHDDPTIRRCIHFAKREGCTNLSVVNLFGFRAAKPKDLKLAVDPHGPNNAIFVSSEINFTLNTGGLVIAAWGANEMLRHSLVRFNLKDCHTMKCLGKTKKGNPRHPLYVLNSEPLIPFGL